MFCLRTLFGHEATICYSSTGRVDYNHFVIALAFLSVFTETFLPPFPLKANLNAVFLWVTVFLSWIMVEPAQQAQSVASVFGPQLRCSQRVEDALENLSCIKNKKFGLRWIPFHTSVANTITKHLPFDGWCFGALWNLIGQVGVAQVPLLTLQYYFYSNC